MFKLQPNPTFWARVEIHRPGDDAQMVEIECRHKSRDDAVRFAESLSERDPLESLREIVVGWRGVDVEFSPDALAAMHQNYASAADRILAAYFDELRGARRKN